jgi:hypothetical protein
MAQELREFYEEEVVESGEARNLLSEPAGPETANIGIILHIRTRKQAEVGPFPFFDLQNRTIQLLAKKSVSDSFTYMFDWHWRAEFGAKVGVNVRHCNGDRVSSTFITNSPAIFLTPFPYPFFLLVAIAPKNNIYPHSYLLLQLSRFLLAPAAR